MPLSFKKDKTETQRSVSLSTPTYAPTQGHRREATTVRESTPDGTPYVDYQVGDDEAPAPDTRVLSELRGCVGQVNVQTQVEDPSTSGRLRADHRPGSTVSSSSHSTASTASFVYPSTPFGTHSRELQDELGYQSQKAGKPMAPQYQYAWTGSSQDEEPDLDALLAMSGGPKSNASSNPFGFEKLSGGGAAPRARREFEEADFYNPTFTNRR